MAARGVQPVGQHGDPVVAQVNLVEIGQTFQANRHVDGSGVLQQQCVQTLHPGHIQTDLKRVVAQVQATQRAHPGQFEACVLAKLQLVMRQRQAFQIGHQ